MWTDPHSRRPGKAVLHPRNLFPCGQSRREFVWEMGGGFTGVALAGLLGMDGVFPRSVRAEEEQRSSVSPSAPRPPQLVTKAKSCIFLMMNGAPSQVDTFDYKPEMYGRDNQTVEIKKIGRAHV